MAKSLNELPLKEPDTGWDYADPSNFAGIRETFNVDTVCSATPADVSWIFGYKGKLVRDNIHSLDVARFIEEFWKEPRIGETYNLGGGRANSVGILEAFEFAAAVSGKKQVYKYVDRTARATTSATSVIWQNAVSTIPQCRWAKCSRRSISHGRRDSCDYLNQNRPYSIRVNCRRR
jgi:nucleoside-diphosphate-sugar epimerase